MDMKDFTNRPEIKFLTVLGKMHASIFGNVGKHIKAMGLNQTEFLILYAIAANGPLTIQDIAARITMTSGNMTYTIDKLVKRNLILRDRCSEDRRMIFIKMTDEGKAKWHDVMEEHIKYMQDVFESVDPSLMVETIESMKTIGKTFDKH